MNLELEDVPAAISALLAKVNNLTILAEHNNRLLRSGQENGYYNKEDLHDLFYLSLTQIRKLVSQGKIKEYALGTGVIYKASEIHAQIVEVKTERGEM